MINYQTQFAGYYQQWAIWHLSQMSVNLKICITKTILNIVSKLMPENFDKFGQIYFSIFEKLIFLFIASEIVPPNPHRAEPKTTTHPQRRTSRMSDISRSVFKRFNLIFLSIVRHLKENGVGEEKE